MKHPHRILIFTLIIGLSFVKATLFPTSDLGSCQSNSTCTIPNTYCNLERNIDCNDGVCVCNTNFIPVSTDPENPSSLTCIPKASNIGQACQHDLQCTSTFGSFSKCDLSTSTCQCSPGTTICQNNDLKVNKCVYRGERKLGEPCDGCNSQCSHISNAVCTYITSGINDTPWRCLCPTGYIQAADGSDQCLPEAYYIGSRCDMGPEQCNNIIGSVCDPVWKRCSCNDTTQVGNRDGNKCLTRKEHLNMECEEGSQCIPENSYCSGLGSCICNSTHVQSKKEPDSCIPTRGYSSSCEENVQCVGDMGINSECSISNMRCQCKQGFIYDSSFDSEMGRCYPLTPLGGKCSSGTYNSHCVDASGSTSKTMCLNGICYCNFYITERNGTCYDSKSFGMTCTTDTECRISIRGPAVCRRDGLSNMKVCRCDDKYQEDHYNWQCVPATVVVPSTLVPTTDISTTGMPTTDVQTTDNQTTPSHTSSEPAVG